MFKIKWTNPKKSQVIIFDSVGSDILEKMVLGDIDHEILHSRGEVIYMTPRILWGIFLNIKYIGSLRQGNKMGLGCLYRVYLLACIQYMKPKIVLTFIDNSYPFQVISRVYKDAQFIAIQNGSRIRDCLKDSRPPFPEPGSIISMPTLICFGQHEVDLYKRFNHHVDHFYPLGSLKARHYRTFLSKKRSTYDFDLCQISIWDEGNISGKHMPQFGRGIIVLDKFINQYLKERDISFCIGLRFNNPKEEEYYVNTYGDRAFLIKANREMMSSYEAIDRSAVTVTGPSTLAWEAFGWGAKVLSCNFSGDDQFNFPCDGFWSLNEPNYELFKEKLDHLIAMDHEEFRRQTKDSARYIMNNETISHHDFVRGLISKSLDLGVKR